MHKPTKSKTSVFEISFKHYQMILDIINTNKIEDGIAHIDSTYIEEKLKLGKLQTNKLIKDLNLYNNVIKKTLDGYTTDCENILDVEWIKVITIMMLDTMENPKLVRETNSELMEKYGIDEKLVQKYRAYILTPPISI